MRPTSTWTWTCKRNPLAALLSCALAWGVLACAEGAPADPPTQIEPPVPVKEPPCGNGLMDQGEMCDCPKLSGKPVDRCPITGAMTCQTLGFVAGGTLLCYKCIFDTTTCTGTGPTGGMGR
jgi:hypothetical protein